MPSKVEVATVVCAPFTLFIAPPFTVAVLDLKSEPVIFAVPALFETAPPFAEEFDSNATFVTVAVLFSPLRLIAAPSEVETASFIATFSSLKFLSSPSVESISNSDQRWFPVIVLWSLP